MITPLKALENTLLLRALKLLKPGDKYKLIAITIFQVLLGLFDIISVALIGLLTAISVNGIQSKSTSFEILEKIPIVDFNQLSFQSQVAVLGAISASLLIIRTALSIYINRKILFFLSRRGALISSSLITKVLGQTLNLVQKNSSQKIIYSVTSGVSAVTLGVIGSSALLIADSSLLLFMSVGLFIYDPLMAVLTALLFAGVGYVLYLFMHLRIKALGEKSADLSIASNQQIMEVLSSFRESFVRNRRAYYANNISNVRIELADANAEMSFMPSISKYVLEITLVVGAVTVAASQFLTRDALSAISSMTVFMAASTRIAPAVLRIQQGILGIKGSVGSAKPTLQMIEDVISAPELPIGDLNIDFTHAGFSPTVSVQSIDFSYDHTKVIEALDIEISPGERVAIVGSSGAGKSTLMDLLIGVLTPQSGVVKISGKSPVDAIKLWQGAISYVPQNIALIEGSIADNVRLGFPPEIISDALVLDALESAQLGDFIESLPLGIQTSVGEAGSRLSGGQKQRIGIARALVTKPKLIFMDEATSSLESKTEEKISETLSSLDESISIILIAHRITTIQHADKIIYLENGRIRAFGNISEVRQLVPEFNEAMSKLLA
jgi:ABC-type multidrug transport system fused ATPase/permease subunit